MYFSTPAWELALFRWLNDARRNPLFDTVMPIFSAPAVLWSLAIGAVLVATRFRLATLGLALCLGMTVGASDLACSFIKDHAQRQRPYHALTSTWYVDSDTWKQRPDDFSGTKKSGSSYPSAHAANAVAAVWILRGAYRTRSVWLIPVLIGLSRIYLGKHFPMDVVAGWITGLAVACALQPIWPALFSRARSLWIR